MPVRTTIQRIEIKLNRAHHLNHPIMAPLHPTETNPRRDAYKQSLLAIWTHHIYQALAMNLPGLWNPTHRFNKRRRSDRSSSAVVLQPNNSSTQECRSSLSTYLHRTFKNTSIRQPMDSKPRYTPVCSVCACFFLAIEEFTAAVLHL